MFQMVLVVEVVVAILDAVAMLVTTTIQMTTTNYDDENKHDDDEEGDLFWLREFDRNKLLLCTDEALALFYNNYIYKEPYVVSYNTGMRWLNEILNGHWIHCVNMFRMDADIL
jgi:hypothetical protein